MPVDIGMGRDVGGNAKVEDVANPSEELMAR